MKHPPKKQATKKAAGARSGKKPSPLKRLAEATVNALMQRLNSIFGLNLPLLPLTGWPEYLKNLWQLFISGQLPSPGDPLPWCIKVQGNFEGLLPEGSTLQVTAHILVGTDTCGSPDMNP